MKVSKRVPIFIGLGFLMGLVVVTFWNLKCGGSFGGCGRMAISQDDTPTLLLGFKSMMSAEEFRSKLKSENVEFVESVHEGVRKIRATRYCPQEAPCGTLTATFVENRLGRISIEIGSGGYKFVKSLKAAGEFESKNSKKSYFRMGSSGSAEIWSEDPRISEKFDGND